jgi:hypothetical protein
MNTGSTSTRNRKTHNNLEQQQCSLNVVDMEPNHGMNQIFQGHEYTGCLNWKRRNLSMT